MMVGRIMMPSTRLAVNMLMPAAVKGIGQSGDPGHQHHDAEEAVDDGGDAGQQLDGGQQDLFDPFRGKEGEIHRGQQAHRHAPRPGAPAVT